MADWASSPRSEQTWDIVAENWASDKDKPTLCKFHASGGCTKGDQCPYSHDLTVQAAHETDASRGFVLEQNVANAAKANGPSPRSLSTPTSAVPPAALSTTGSPAPAEVVTWHTVDPIVVPERGASLATGFLRQLYSMELGVVAYHSGAVPGHPGTIARAAAGCTMLLDESSQEGAAAARVGCSRWRIAAWCAATLARHLQVVAARLAFTPGPVIAAATAVQRLLERSSNRDGDGCLHEEFAPLEQAAASVSPAEQHHPAALEVQCTADTVLARPVVHGATGPWESYHLSLPAVEWDVAADAPADPSVAAALEDLRTHYATRYAAAAAARSGLSLLPQAVSPVVRHPLSQQLHPASPPPAYHAAVGQPVGPSLVPMHAQPMHAQPVYAVPGPAVMQPAGVQYAAAPMAVVAGSYVLTSSGGYAAVPQ